MIENAPLNAPAAPGVTTPNRQRWIRAGWWVAALAVLGGVFLLYTRPAFMVAMIDQVWACF